MSEKYSQPIRADKDGFYMGCPEEVGIRLASQLKGHKRAVELCCGIGALSIQLAKEIPYVVGIDMNKDRIKNARHNAKLYGVQKRTLFLFGDVLDRNLLKSLFADVAILDPDWSKNGEEKTTRVPTINDTQPSLQLLYNLTKELVTPNIIAKVPLNFTEDTLKDIGVRRLEKVYWEGRERFQFAYFF